MKKWLKKTLVLLCSVMFFTTVGALIGCGSCKDGGDCDHDWDEGVVTVQATCTERGEITFTCEDCGETKTESVSPSHTFVDAITAPTCTEDGYTTHTCEKCGYKRVDTVVEATGHSYTKESTAPTCTEDGYDTYTCACGNTYTDISARKTGHDTTGVTWTVAGDDELIDSDTCTYERTETAECKVCHEDVEKTYTIVKHSYKTVVSEYATCQATGTKTHTCEGCGDTETEAIAINANAHDWDEGVENNGVKTYTCNHNSAHTKKEVTLVETGNTATIPAEAKQADVELKMENATMKMDETLVGKLPQDVELTAGKFEQTDAAVSDAVNAMTPENKERLGDAEIFNFGLTSGGQNVDFDGGKMTVSVPYVLQKGDDPDCIAIWYIGEDGVVEMISATYANGFATFETEHFSLYTVVRMTAKERCAAYGHKYQDTVVAPTCDEEGYTIHTCKVCHDVKRDTFVAAIGHNYTSSVTAPTCTEMGYTTNTCTNCHDVYISNRTPMIKHSFQDTVVAPTCTQDGYTMHVCEHCHKTNVDNYVDKLGHSYKEGICEVCGAKDPNYAGATNNFYVTLFTSAKENANQFYVEIDDMEIVINMPERQINTIEINNAKFSFTIGANGEISAKGEMDVVQTTVYKASATVAGGNDETETAHYVMKFVIQDGKMYAAMEEQEDGRIIHNYSYQPMEEIPMDEMMASMINQLLPIVDENVQVIIEKMVTASGSPTEASLKRAIEYFFTKTETDDGYSFALNFEVIPEIYEFVMTGTVGDLFDVVCGEGKFDETVTWLKGSVDKTVNDIIAEFSVNALKSGLDLNDVYALVDAVLVVMMPAQEGEQQKTAQTLIAQVGTMTIRQLLDSMMEVPPEQAVDYAAMVDAYAAEIKEMPILDVLAMISGMGSGSMGPEDGMMGEPDQNVKPMSDTSSQDPILALIENAVAALEDTFIGFTTDKLGNIKSLNVNLGVEEFVLDLAAFIGEEATCEVKATGEAKIVLGETFMTEYKDVVAKIDAAKSVLNFTDGQVISSNYSEYVVEVVNGQTFIVSGTQEDDVDYFRDIFGEYLWAYYQGEDVEFYEKQLENLGVYELELEVVDQTPYLSFVLDRSGAAYIVGDDFGYSFYDSCTGWSEFYASMDYIDTIAKYEIAIDFNLYNQYSGYDVEIVKCEIDWEKTLEWNKVREGYGFDFYYNNQTKKYTKNEPHKWVVVRKYEAQKCEEWSYEIWRCSVCGEERMNYTWYKSHKYVRSYELEQGSTSCEDGYWAIQTCVECGNEERYFHDDEYKKHPYNSYDEKVATTHCGEVYILYDQCPCGLEGNYPTIGGDCKFYFAYYEHDKTPETVIDGKTVYHYDSRIFVCPVVGCGAAYRVESWSTYDECARTEYYRFTFGLEYVKDQLTEVSKVVKTFSDFYGYAHSTETEECPKDTAKGLEHVYKEVCTDCGEVFSYYGQTCDEYGRILRTWNYLANSGDIYEYSGCHYTRYRMNEDGSRGELCDDTGTSHVDERYISSSLSCTQYEYGMWYCFHCDTVVNCDTHSSADGHDFKWDDSLELFVCTRCDMESYYPGSGNFYLEDLTDKYGNEDELVVGFFNRGLESWSFTVIINYDPLNNTGTELVDFDGYDVVYYTGNEPFSWVNVRCGQVYVDRNALVEAITAAQITDVENISVVFEYWDYERNEDTGEYETEPTVFFEAVTYYVGN